MAAGSEALEEELGVEPLAEGPPVVVGEGDNDGVDVGRVSEIAAAAAVDPSAGGNPIPFTEAFAAEVFANACTGTLEGSR